MKQCCDVSDNFMQEKMARALPAGCCFGSCDPEEEENARWRGAFQIQKKGSGQNGMEVFTNAWEQDA